MGQDLRKERKQCNDKRKPSEFTLGTVKPFTAGTKGEASTGKQPHLKTFRNLLCAGRWDDVLLLSVSLHTPKHTHYSASLLT
jgi:hypothetical protein